MFQCCTYIFSDFKKYRVTQKPKALAFGFTEKTFVPNKNWSKSIFYPHDAHILFSIRLYSVGHNLFEVLKNIEFWLKIHRLAFGVTKNCLSKTKTSGKSIFN
jgi:hypothetical protein